LSYLIAQQASLSSPHTVIILCFRNDHFPGFSEASRAQLQSPVFSSFTS
jgi:hypothetical protein